MGAYKHQQNIQKDNLHKQIVHTGTIVNKSTNVISKLQKYQNIQNGSDTVKRISTRPNITAKRERVSKTKAKIKISDIIKRFSERDFISITKRPSGIRRTRSTTDESNIYTITDKKVISQDVSNSSEKIINNNNCKTNHKISLNNFGTKIKSASGNIINNHGNKSNTSEIRSENMNGSETNTSKAGKDESGSLSNLGRKSILQPDSENRTIVIEIGDIEDNEISSYAVDNESNNNSALAPEIVEYSSRCLLFLFIKDYNPSIQDTYQFIKLYQKYSIDIKQIDENHNSLYFEKQLIRLLKNNIFNAIVIDISNCFEDEFNYQNKLFSIRNSTNNKQQKELLYNDYKYMYNIREYRLFSSLFLLSNQLKTDLSKLMKNNIFLNMACRRFNASWNKMLKRPDKIIVKEFLKKIYEKMEFFMNTFAICDNIQSGNKFIILK